MSFENQITKSAWNTPELRSLSVQQTLTRAPCQAQSEVKNQGNPQAPDGIPGLCVDGGPGSGQTS